MRQIIAISVVLGLLAIPAHAQAPIVGVVGTAIPSPNAAVSVPASLLVPTISWGVVANPADDGAIVTAAAYLANTSGKITAQAKALQAGADHMQEVLKWTDVEATLGVYTFTKVDTLVDNSGSVPLVLNIAPIWDDGTTSLPATLAFTAFSDAAVITAYQNMLTALRSHLDGRLYVLLVGNEVDTYLTTASRRSQYATFLTAVRTTARSLFGTNPFLVGTVLRSSVVGSWADWAAIDAATDVNGFTYYPAVPVVSATFAATVLGELAAMSALGPMVFQEIGVSSSAGGSSEAFQSAAVQTLTGVIALLADVPGKQVPVVTWAQLSDLSAAVIADFGYSSGQLTPGLGLRTTANVGKAGYATLCGYLGGTSCNDPPAPPAPTCTFTIAASSDTFTAAAGSDTVALTASDAGCAWTRELLDGAPSWLTVTPASGVGTATITYSVTVNTSTASRSARFTIGDGDVFTVTQAGAEPPTPDPDPETTVTCLDTTPSPTGRTPIFGWTPCRQTKLNRMYADYLTNPANPPTVGGKLMKLLKGNADCDCRYADFGQHDTLMFQATGDAAYAAKAYTKIQAVTRQIADMVNFDTNTPRDMAIRWIWNTDKIWGTLTATQQATLTDNIEDVFDRWVSHLRPGDSDECVGTYFSVVMLHLLLPSDTRAAAFYTLPIIGGLVPSKLSSATLVNQSDINARNAIRRFFEVFGDGGEWPEGDSLYNYGTTQYVMEGTDAIKTATGIDYFPEFTTWLPQWGKHLLTALTPDRVLDVAWGDDQNPGQFQKYIFAANLLKTEGLLRGTATGRQLQGFYLDLIAQYGISGGGTTMEPLAAVGDALSFMFYDPYETADAWETSANLSYFSKGVGLMIQKSGHATTSSFLMTQTQPAHLATTGADAGKADHVDHYTYYTGDWMFYRNGEMVINHPMSYAGPHIISGEGGNSALMHGFGSAPEYKGDNISASQSTVHAYSAVTTGGSLQEPDGTNYAYAQAAFSTISVHEWTREFLYVPGTTDTVFVFDRANVTPLTQPERYAQTTAAHPDYYGYSTGLTAASANIKMFSLHMPVVPTINGNEITWTSPAKSIPVKWTSLLPATTNTTTFNEAILSSSLGTCSTIYGCPAWGGFFPTEYHYHVKRSPTTTQQWEPFLNVIQMGTAGVVTLKSNSGCVGAQVTRPGQEDMLGMFNGTQGADLTLAPYDLTNHNTALATVRYRGVGCTASWIAAGTATLVFHEDLDPNATWTVNKDGAGAVALARCTTTPQTDCLTANGEYRTTIAAAGAHNYVLVGSGTAPPPPPPSCPTITLSPTSEPDGTTGTAYSQTISASGGTGPYTFTVMDGSLPPGLTLSSAGLLAGTPTTSGTYMFTVKGTQAPDLCFGSQSYTLVVNAAATLAIARNGTAQTLYEMSGSASVLSGTITTTAGSNRLGVFTLFGGGTDTFTSCTYNGSALTLIEKMQVTGDLWLYALRLVAPTVGANTMTCTFSAPSTMAGLWFEYVGVDQTTPTAQIGSGASTNTYTSTATTTIHTALTPSKTNTWTILMGRAWTALTAGLGSSEVIGLDGFGMKAFDAGPHVSAGVERIMEASLSLELRGGGLMFTINPSP